MTPNEAAQLHALIDQLTVVPTPATPPTPGPVTPPVATDRTGHQNPKPPSHPPARK